MLLLKIRMNVLEHFSAILSYFRIGFKHFLISSMSQSFLLIQKTTIFDFFVNDVIKNNIMKEHLAIMSYFTFFSKSNPKISLFTINFIHIHQIKNERFF